MKDVYARLEEDFGLRGLSARSRQASIFVEEKKGHRAGHKACADHYWPLGRRNPLIDQSTVSITESARFVKVFYMLKGEKGDVKFDVPNINLYFEYQGRWVDVHISKFPVHAGDDEMMEAFVKSLNYEKASQPVAPADRGTRGGSRSRTGRRQGGWARSRGRMSRGR